MIWHDAYLTSLQYWPFVRELLNIFYSQRASDAELRCCLWCQPDQMVQQIVELSLTWDPMTLKWHHCIGRLDLAPKRLKCIWNNRVGVNWSTQWKIDTGKKATYVSIVSGNAVYCFYWSLFHTFVRITETSQSYKIFTQITCLLASDGALICFKPF